MTNLVEVYWSFRSPYSYLVLPQLESLSEDFGVEIAVKPVYPLAVRDVSFFTNRRPQQMPYMLHDMLREAERLSIPFRWPRPDPIVQDIATMSVAAEQPRIDRLMLLGAIAQREKGVQAFAFFREVSKILFDGNTDDWDQGEHLAEAVARGGFDLATMEQTAAADKAALLKLIEGNEQEQQQYHWGVPLMVYSKEGFFGQDRIPALRWRLENR